MRIILWKFELVQGDDLCVLIEDDEPCRTKIRLSCATWRIKMYGDGRCSAVESTDELRVLEHMLRRCRGC